MSAQHVTSLTQPFEEFSQFLYEKTLNSKKGVILHRLIFNWRLNLFRALMVLVVIGSYAAQTEHLSDGWWFGQNRLPGACLQVIRQSRVVFLRHHRCGTGWVRWLTVPGKDLIRWLMYHLLAFSGLVLVKILLWALSKVIGQGVGPLQCSWKWRISKPSVTIEMGMAVRILPNQTGEGAIWSTEGLVESSFESPALTGMPVLLPALSNADTYYPAHGCVAVCETVASASPLTPSIVSAQETQSPCVAPLPSYGAATEREMKKFYGTLSEKDKRRYAAIEALKLGRGGRVSIERILGCTRKTIAKGIKELRELPENAGYDPRIRRSGAGRHRYDVIYEGIDEKFLKVLKEFTAGDPMREEVIWTHLTPGEIARKIEEMYQLRVSTTVVRQLIKKHGYHRRKAQKKETMKDVAYRNEQFENIAMYKKAYEQTGNPVISMDTKKKEYLGNFYREGHLYTREEIKAFDHDFNSFAEGIIIPHAIYDIIKNKGYINIGTSKDTSQFACDSLRNWWYNQGRLDYPSATSILILCDGGGSNNSKHYLFKEDLQKLANEIGVELRIAHYPPYTSKYNPIEHRLFPHVTRACQGVIFRNIELVRQLMEKTTTKQGLKVNVQIIDTVYETARKVSDDFKKKMSILFDQFLPQWNYRAVPNG